MRISFRNAFWDFISCELLVLLWASIRGTPMDSHLSRDTFCELVVRQNCHLEDAQDPWPVARARASLQIA